MRISCYHVPYTVKPRIFVFVGRLKTIDAGACLLACWFLAELISSTLKMEAICSSETSVDTQRTTRPYIPEVDTLHNHHCENLKSFRIIYFKNLYDCGFRSFAQICHKGDKFSKVLKKNLQWKTYQLEISFLANFVSRQQ
jgi:hypothetical protein